jgi:hypothetical protein
MVCAARAVPSASMFAKSAAISVIPTLGASSSMSVEYAIGLGNLSAHTLPANLMLCCRTDGLTARHIHAGLKLNVRLRRRPTTG